MTPTALWRMENMTTHPMETMEHMPANLLCQTTKFDLRDVVASDVPTRALLQMPITLKFTSDKHGVIFLSTRKLTHLWGMLMMKLSTPLYSTGS